MSFPAEYAWLRTMISSQLQCPGQSIASLPLSTPVRRSNVTVARVYKRELTCVESRSRHRISTILPTQYSWDSRISVTALPCGCMIALTSGQELRANDSRMHTLIINFEGVRLAFVVSHYDSHRRRPHRNIKPTTRSLTDERCMWYHRCPIIVAQCRVS